MDVAQLKQNMPLKHDASTVTESPGISEVAGQPAGGQVTRVLLADKPRVLARSPLSQAAATVRSTAGCERVVWWLECGAL